MLSYFFNSVTRVNNVVSYLHLQLSFCVQWESRRCFVPIGKIVEPVLIKSVTLSLVPGASSLIYFGKMT